jgi:glyoxylase I family protein
MLKGFEHIGMTVSNLDRSIAFYEGLLGMKLLLRKRQRDGGEVAFLDAGGGQLEINQPPGEVITPARRPAANEAGLKHITIAFDDIDAVYRQLMAAGVPSVEPPRDAYNREMLARVGFVLDPDGIVVELAQRN